MAEPITYSTIEQLLARISDHMTENHNQENTGERTQQLLKEIALGVLAIVGAAPQAAASIQPWDDGLEYTDQVIVSHNGFLWLFAGGLPNTGTQPGTNATVWMPLGAQPTPTLAQVLTAGQRTGAHDLDVDAGQAIAFRGAESDGRIRLVPQAVTDDGVIQLPAANGILALTSQLPDLSTLNLHEVLVNGTETNGRSITVNEGDGVNFGQGANYARLKAPVSLTAVRSLTLPDKDGTVATTDDVAAVAALVDGTMRAPEAYTPSGGLYPTTYGGNPIQKGDAFRCGAGTMGSVTVNAEDLLIALVDVPGQTNGNWQVLESNRVVATQAEVENNSSTDLVKLVPPQRWWQAWTKGLSLAAFGNAVRGMVLTGYAVGANAAVAAGDSIMGAIAKLQGQVNATNTAVGGKLAKASNLSDLVSASAARANLELGAMAVEDTTHSTEVRVPPGDAAHGVKDTIPEWIVVNPPPFLALDYEPAVPGWGAVADIPGKWVLAHSGRNGGRVMGVGVGIVNFSPTSLEAKRIYTSGQFEILAGVGVVDPTGGLQNVTWCLTNKAGLMMPSGYTGESPAGPGTVVSENLPIMVSTAGPVMPGYDMRCLLMNTVGGPARGAASGSGMVQITGGVVTNLGEAAGGEKLFGTLLDTVSIDPGVYQVEIKLALKVKDTVNSPALPGHASVSLEVLPNTVTNKAYGTLTKLEQAVGGASSAGIASEAYDLPTKTWTALQDAGDDVLQVSVLRGIVALPSNASGGVEAVRNWRVRIASSDGDHTVTNAGMSYITWNKIKGV